MEYRICKNDWGYYKIQRLRIPVVLFGKTIRKEKWVDGCFNYLPIVDVYELTLFKTREQAEQKIEQFKQEDQKQDKRRNINWTWVGRIYE